MIHHSTIKTQKLIMSSQKIPIVIIMATVAIAASYVRAADDINTIQAMHITAGERRRQISAQSLQYRDHDMLRGIAAQTTFLSPFQPRQRRLSRGTSPLVKIEHYCTLTRHFDTNNHSNNPIILAQTQKQNEHEQELKTKANEIVIPVIFENDHLLAVCKPPHIPHHDDPASGQLGIMSIIRLQQQEQESKLFPYPHRLYGVHRLDRVTSGILLFAKSPSIANLLVQKFRNKEVTKYYMAISGKKPKKKKQGWVKGMMAIGRRGSYKLMKENESEKNERNVSNTDLENEDDAVDGIEDDEEPVLENEKKHTKNRGGYAVTRFFTAGLGFLDMAKPLKALSDHSNRNNEDAMSEFPPVPKTAILFQPHTGKTHQLRVAAKSVGMPILGDTRYSGGRVLVQSTDTNAQITDKNKISDEFDRTYLHASAIHFQLNDNEDVTIWSPPPFDHLFFDSDLRKDGGNSVPALTNVFVGMMDKYCDCPPILEAIRNAT